MNAKQTESFVENFWDREIVPTLTEYVAIPCKSPAFDADWEKNGHMDAALELALNWLERNKPDDAVVTVGRSPGRTPCLFVELDGDPAKTVLMYGHLDKQPEMSGWEEGLGPWTPVIRDGKLYGRGGADDGYALFASLCAVLALREQEPQKGRIVILIEFSEESASTDLPFYIDEYKSLIGTPGLVVCLDSGAGNYEQLWNTTSLRGLVSANFTVRILDEGVHSGDASGVVPSSFRIQRELLNRLEDVTSGEILPPGLRVDIPAERLRQASIAGENLGALIFEKFPFVDGASPVTEDPAELVLNRSWRAFLEVIAFDGAPPPEKAGNVLRPETTLKLSLRLPPTLDPKSAENTLIEVLSANVPGGAQVDVQIQDSAGGWNAPGIADWLETALDQASMDFFQKPCVSMGEGGSIPFMGMLGEKFPQAQFVITGVLGPHSNAHGPNEFLHIPYAKKVTACIVNLLSAFF